MASENNTNGNDISESKSNESKANENKPPKDSGAAKGLTTQKTVLILGALVIVCAAIVTVFILTRDSEPETTGARLIDEGNLAEITAEIEEKVAKGMFETHMTTTWTFPDGESPSTDAVMGNSPNNNYPFWFEVILSGTDEVVYTSSLLPLGSQLEEIVLDENPGAGTYPANLRIHMIEEDGSEVETNMGFNVTLIIEN
jgi:hypothetical protein